MSTPERNGQKAKKKTECVKLQADTVNPNSAEVDEEFCRSLSFCG